MSHDDFDFEPVRGLPAALPEGESVLWQGTPSWKALAVRSYHVRKVAVYFFLLVLWRVVNGLSDGHTPSAIAVSSLFIVALGAVAIGVLSLLAYTNARSTVYTITNRRVLLRHGVAVPLTMNLPFSMVDNAALKSFANGTGDIAFTVSRSDRVGYLINWPHVRPGAISRPEPSLRALNDADEAARILGLALARHAGSTPTSASYDGASAGAGSAAAEFGPRTTVAA